MVLDGVSDPAAVSSAMASTQVAALEDAFAEVDAACAADPSCPFSAQGRRLPDASDELAAQVAQGAGAGSGVGPTQPAYAPLSAPHGPPRPAPLRRSADTRPPRAPPAMPRPP